MEPQLITAAVTAYNAAETIGAALLSVLDQDWPRLEVIVVDDASTDRTAEIVEAFIREHVSGDTTIRLIRLTKNGGVAQARNRLVDEAQGEFLTFFDDDDISAPDRISRQYVRILEAEGAVGHDLLLCYAARNQVFPDGSSSYEGTMGCEGDVIPSGTAIVDRILTGRLSPGVLGACATCSQMARVSVYRRLGGFDRNLRRSEDTDLNIRLGIQGGSIVGVADVLVEQKMTVGAEKNLVAELDAYSVLQDKYRDYLRQIGWYEFVLAWRGIRRAHLESGYPRAALLGLILCVRHPLKLIQKLYWSLPARASRRRQREWYRSAFQDAA